MLKSVVVMVFLCMGLTAYCQDAVNLEPTSATDGGVKLQKTKKFRFQRSTRMRKTENHGEPVKSSRIKAEVPVTEHAGGSVRSSRYTTEARGTERHDKSYKKSRAGKKSNGQARVYKKPSPSSSSPRKSKVRRSLGRD